MSNKGNYAPKAKPSRVPRMGRRPRKPPTVELSPAPTASAVGDGAAVVAGLGDPRDVSDVYAGAGAESAHRSIDGGESGERRDLFALMAALDGALAGITPSLPLTMEDAAAIFDITRQYAPAPLIRDVMHDHREIVVRVYDGKRQVYEHRMKAR